MAGHAIQVQMFMRIQSCMNVRAGFPFSGCSWEWTPVHTAVRKKK